MIMLGKF